MVRHAATRTETIINGAGALDLADGKFTFKNPESITLWAPGTMSGHIFTGLNAARRLNFRSPGMRKNGGMWAMNPGYDRDNTRRPLPLPTNAWAATIHIHRVLAASVTKQRSEYSTPGNLGATATRRPTIEVP